MRRLALSVLIAGAITAGASAQAEVQTPEALPPADTSILAWTPVQQATGYRNIEKIYPTRVIEAGPVPSALPDDPRALDFAWVHDGRTYTVASFMKAFNVSGLLVLKDGQVVLERYGLGRAPQDRWTSFSVAKSITSTLIGAAIQDGHIKGLDDKVTLYIPELAGSAYDDVSIRQLLTMTSGVQWNEDYADPNSDVARSGSAVVEPGLNPIVSYMRRLPRAAEPGSRFNYNTSETDLAGIVVSRAVGKPLSEYLSETIWRPAGMEQDAVWMLDAGGHERGGCCISMSLRDYGRFGQFVLEGGRAGGEQVVPEGWFAEATRTHLIVPDYRPAPTGYGYFWWTRPTGAVEAVGIFGQSITIFPEEKLVVVVNSAWPRATGLDLGMPRLAFVHAVRDALR